MSSKHLIRCKVLRCACSSWSDSFVFWSVCLDSCKNCCWGDYRTAKGSSQGCWEDFSSVPTFWGRSHSFSLFWKVDSGTVCHTSSQRWRYRSMSLRSDACLTTAFLLRRGSLAWTRIFVWGFSLSWLNRWFDWFDDFRWVSALVWHWTSYLTPFGGNSSSAVPFLAFYIFALFWHTLNFSCLHICLGDGQRNLLWSRESRLFQGLTDHGWYLPRNQRQSHTQPSHCSG